MMRWLSIAIAAGMSIALQGQSLCSGNRRWGEVAGPKTMHSTLKSDSRAQDEQTRISGLAPRKPDLSPRPALSPEVREKFEIVGCPFCGCEEAMAFRRSADIVRCVDCDTVFLRTRFKNKVLEQLYQTYADDGSHMALPKDRAQANSSGLKRNYFLQEILEFTKPNGRILDVGCGWGAFLLNARDHGFQPTGMELTRKAVGYANTELNIPVVNTQFLDTPYEAESLRVVTMLHVLEHLPLPRRAIAKIFRTLEPGGLFCGIVPNVESFCSQAQGENWFWLDPNYHYVHYSPETLKKHLENAGFHVERIYTVKGDYCVKQLRQAAEEALPALRGNDAAFAAFLEENEKKGRGEEIRFFARKPERIEKTKKTWIPLHASTPIKAREEGYSFCIMTDGKRPEKLVREIESIHALKIPAFEILVGGEPPADLVDVTVVPLIDAARSGRLGEIRNRLVERSRYNHLIVADDDLFFHGDFYKGLKEYGEDYDVLCVRLLNPDGTRNWDWARTGGRQDRVLLDYDDTDPNLRIPGSLCIVKAEVAEVVRWDENRGKGQEEDIDFSRRLLASGASIKFNERSTVTHADFRFTQVGMNVLDSSAVRAAIQRQVADNELDEARELYQRLRAMDPEENLIPEEQAELSLFVQKREGKYVYLSPAVFPDSTDEEMTQEALNATAQRLQKLLTLVGPFQMQFGGAGDALLHLASFYDLAPGSTVVCFANSTNAARSLFDAFPLLGTVYFLPPNRSGKIHLLLRLLMKQMPNCLGMGATPENDYFKEWNKELNIFEKYNVTPMPEWAARFRKRDSSKREVVLAPKGSLAGMVGSKRNLIDPRIWPEVVRFILQLGFHPIIIGTPDDLQEYPCLEGCDDQRSYSFKSQMEWIGRCELLVGADSWAKTFSALANVPTIVFESLKGPDWRGRKDPSDYVFLHPWPVITVVKDLEQFKTVFHRRILEMTQDQFSNSASTEAASKPLQIAWEGTFLDFGSLSHVNRALVTELSKQAEFNVTCVGKKESSAAVPPALHDWPAQLKPNTPNNTQVTVRHAWPPKWNAPVSGPLVVIQPWEYGALPKDWVEKSRQVRRFWVPSEYARRVYVNSGIPASKVNVVPNGIDPATFSPEAAPLHLETQKKFKFLFVGGTISRKGPDVLLAAFLASFTRNDDVCLVIKDFGGNGVYAGQTMGAEIRAAQARADAPEILHLTSEISPDEMAGLYTACDCLVHPYRGEGFGLPVLEAMACGLPVVVTAGGATDDFALDAYAYKIPAKIRAIGMTAGGMRLAREGWVLEPDGAVLARQLRSIFENPEESRRKGKAASVFAREFWSWRKVAETVAGTLKGLVAAEQAEANALAARRARKNAPMEIPPVARIGDLTEARGLMSQKQWAPASEATFRAISVRPFHPEGFLLLSEIAAGAGDSTQSKIWLERGLQLAPKWSRLQQSARKNLSDGGIKLSWPVAPLAAASPRLTVCLIVKNEEQFLRRCLQSVRELAYQIVVVDTGSTDRTVEIAREFKAEVHDFAWNDDFSAARNEALQHATGDWVLMLDADEELQPQHRQTIQQEMLAIDTIAYRIPIIDYGKEHEGSSYVPRLFRNAPGLYFVGRIHEQVFGSVEKFRKEWGMENRLGRTTLLHHGYSEEVAASRNKIERNLTLLERALEEIPNDANLVMNYGLELVRSGQLMAGLDHYWEAFHLMSRIPGGEVSPELRETLLTQLFTHLLRDRQFSEIVRLSQTPLARSRGLTASHHFVIGLAQMELKQPQAAVDHMRQCLAKRHLATLSPIHPEILKGGVNHTLAIALAGLKKAEAAAEAFQAALADDPESRPVKFDFAMFQAGRGDAVESLKLLHQIVAKNPRDLQAWGAGAQIALERPEFTEFARDWTAEAMKFFPQNSDITLLHAQALLLNGDPETALPLWTQSHCKTFPRHIAALILCEIVTTGSRRNFVPSEERMISHEFLKWYQQLVKTGANSLVYRLHANMERLRKVLPSFVTTWEAAVGDVEQAVTA